MARLTTAAAAALLALSPITSAHSGARPYGQHPALQARQASASATHGGSATGGAASGTGNIVANPVSEPTSALPASATPTPGSTPTGVVKGAPPIPQGTPSAANYPTLDRPPPVDSPEVQQWLSEIDLSKVPNIKPTVEGGCAANPDAAANAGENGNCWWTCGHCVRDSDVSYCPKKEDWGTSYDDGPGPYTPNLLSYLDANNLKTTFFVVGSRAVSRPDMLLYEYVDGHQLSVHTWSHFSLTTLTNEQIVAELGWTKKIIKEITGVTPSTMRPPFGDIDDRVRNIAIQMGLQPIIWTVNGPTTYDTQDWQIPAGTVDLKTVQANFDAILGNASTLDTGFIVLQHDLYQQAVDIATQIVLPAAKKQNLNMIPIVECLGMDLSEAYIETSSNKSGTFGGDEVASGSAIGASGTAPVPGVADARPSGGSSGGSGGGNSDSAAGVTKAGLAAVAGAVLAGATVLMA